MLFLRPLGGIRTHMFCSEHWNLNPARLPVSPRGVVSPRLTLGDRADLSALFQREEEFFVLDDFNHGIHRYMVSLFCLEGDRWAPTMAAEQPRHVDT